MQKDIFERIISFLLGASWAIVLFGALVTFTAFFSFVFSFALFMTTLYIIFSLFMILALDSFSVNKKRLEEAKKNRQNFWKKSTLNIRNSLDEKSFHMPSFHK